MPDYGEILDGTVDEVKDEVSNLDDPDYQKLLEHEKDGKDRKTLTDYFENRMDATETLQEAEEVAEEHSQGLLDRLPKQRILLGGVALGLVIGLVAGFTVGDSGSTVDRVSSDKVQQDMKELVTAGSFNGTVEVDEPEVTNGMYYLNLTMTQQGPNGTQTQSQQAYVSLDGQLLFPVRKNILGQVVSPINLPDRIKAAQQQQQNSQPRQEPGGNDTSESQTG